MTREGLLHSSERSLRWAARLINCAFLGSVIVLVAFTLAPKTAAATSFDCGKAAGADERAICNNDELSGLDDAMAAGYREARKQAPAVVKRLSRSLLAERRACGADVECLRSAMTKAVGAYKAIILGDPVGDEQKNKVYYGSRAGMQVSVVSRSGIDTPRAVIHVEHRREDAVAFCRDYIQKVTDECIQDEMAIKLGSKLSGDCKTGRFTTVNDQTYVFLGRNTTTDPGTMGNDFVLIDADTNQPLDGSMASGYPVAISQFEQLCPARMR
jgi:uncharacterized protein YecT (DUF1311 family)